MSQDEVARMAQDDAKLEEIKTELVNDVKEATGSEDKSKAEEVDHYSSEEVIALSQGWDPDKEFTAAEYLRRGELFKKISTQSEQIREMRETLKNLSQHVTRSERTAYEKALADLTLKRDQAIEAGDKDMFYNAEQQTKILQQEMEKHAPLPANQPMEISPEVKDFTKRNADWFNDKPENKELVEAALFFDNYIHQSQPGIAPAEAIKLIEAKIKKNYPERFTNAKKEAPATVITSTAGKSAKSSGTGLVSQMTAQQVDIGKQFVKYTPGYTLERYAEELQKQGSLGK